MTEIFPSLSKYSIKKDDERGSLEVLYESRNMVLKRSFSKKGVFRGLHLQRAPHEQTKLIRVVSGKIIDFVVEINGRESELYWKEVDASTDDWVKIDSKFAHGFYAMEDTVFEYICDGGYNEGVEESYSIADFLIKVFGIPHLITSEKDSMAPPLNLSKSHKCI